MTEDNLSRFSFCGDQVANNEPIGDVVMRRRTSATSTKKIPMRDDTIRLCGAKKSTHDKPFIEINNLLSGDGSLEKLRIDTIHAPGESTAVVSLIGDYTNANSGELHLEIAGLTSGDEHDQLNSSGTVSRGEDLVVMGAQLGGAYIPSPRDRFTLIESTSTIRGTFATGSLPGTIGDRLVSWQAVDYSDPNRVAAEIADVSFLAGDVDGLDMLVWQRQFGSGGPAITPVPEPSTARLAIMISAAAAVGRYGRLLNVLSVFAERRQRLAAER
ncbi:MAG: hypothetical protein AAF961_06095 [Planctomycetota bacterium]